MRKFLNILVKDLLIVGMCVGVALVAIPLVPATLLALALAVPFDLWRERRRKLAETARNPQTVWEPTDAVIPMEAIRQARLQREFMASMN